MRAARVCRRQRLTLRSPASPSSQLRPEGGPCQRSASTRAVQVPIVTVRSSTLRVGWALPASRRSAKAPAQQARDAHSSGPVGTHPGRFAPRVPTTPSTWRGASLHCAFPALPYPRRAQAHPTPCAHVRATRVFVGSPPASSRAAPGWCPGVLQHLDAPFHLRRRMAAAAPSGQCPAGRVLPAARCPATPECRSSPPSFAAAVARRRRRSPLPSPPPPSPWP